MKCCTRWYLHQESEWPTPGCRLYCHHPLVVLWAKPSTAQRSPLLDRFRQTRPIHYSNCAARSALVSFIVYCIKDQPVSTIFTPSNGSIKCKILLKQSEKVVFLYTMSFYIPSNNIHLKKSVEIMLEHFSDRKDQLKAYINPVCLYMLQYDFCTHLKMFNGLYIVGVPGCWLGFRSR